MPLRTGPKRRASMASLARRTGVLFVVAALAAAAAAGPANADKVSDTRAQIAQVENELNSFNQQLDAAVEAWNQAESQLTQVKSDIRENTRRLKLAKANLRVAKQHLAAFLVSSYKGDSTDVFEVLGSGSFTDLLNRVEYVQRMSDAEGELLAQVQKAEHEIQVRQAKLKVDAPFGTVPRSRMVASGGQSGLTMDFTSGASSRKNEMNWGFLASCKRRSNR